MQVRRCTKCMGELKEGVQLCPYCSYEQDSTVQPGIALKRNTILHGRYLIGNVIGQGGFGITYVGWDLTLEMKVAVKEYFPSGSATRTNSYSNQIQWNFTGDENENCSEGMDRFLKEARRMAKLDSVPAIVRVRDAFAENQTAYIVMDFVEGETLKKYLLSHGVLRYEECMALLSPILDSLAVIHDCGFIHRDISPDNIMLQPDGTARLLDMGAAVDVEASGGHASMAVVKRNFSAPEQYMESELLGSWTDVYAMAATVYYCMTGKVVPEALEREFKKTPLHFESNLNIPSHVVDALNDALALNAENRIRDMREFKRRLSIPAAGTAIEREIEKTEEKQPAPPPAPEPISLTVPYIEEPCRRDPPERKEEKRDAPVSEKAGRTPMEGLKRALKIVMITIGALSTMFVLLVVFLVSRPSERAAAPAAEGIDTVKAETTAEPVVEKTTAEEATTEVAETTRHTGGRMIMATNAEFPPFEYREGGEIKGIDMEIARLIADELGMELEIIDVAFDSLMPMVFSGQADFAMAGLTRTDYRNDIVDFSDSYIGNSQRIIVTQDSGIETSGDLSGKVVGVQVNTAGDVCSFDLEAEGAAVERYTKGSQAVQALVQGDIDAVLIDDGPAQIFVERESGLKILEEPFTDDEFAVAVKKGNSELLERINRVLDQLKESGELDEIEAKYMNAG